MAKAFGKNSGKTSEKTLESQWTPVANDNTYIIIIKCNGKDREN